MVDESDAVDFSRVGGFRQMDGYALVPEDVAEMSLRLGKAECEPHEAADPFLLP